MTGSFDLLFSHLPGFHLPDLAPFAHNVGCRVSKGRVPPPLLISHVPFILSPSQGAFKEASGKKSRHFMTKLSHFFFFFTFFYLD